MRFFRYKILVTSILATAILIVIKYFLHAKGLELIELTTLHRSVLTGTFFVISFLLTSTMSDYKESERIPAKFSAIIESMFEDASSIHANYKKFDMNDFRLRLKRIAAAFAVDVRKKRRSTRLKIYDLNGSFSEMEKVGIPPNYIVKLKQQQAQLLEILYRVVYIQRIKSIPSASTLVRLTVALSIFLILFTDTSQFIDGAVIAAIITFLFIYILLLIDIINVPFRKSGRTKDDVSLFLVDETVKHLSSNK
jgi:hypothetical protein